MKKTIAMPKDFPSLVIQEEDGYYHFWLNERCVGYAWRTRTGFGTADRPLQNLVTSLTPYIKSFDEQVQFVDGLRDVSIKTVHLLNSARTMIEVKEESNLYNEVLKIKSSLDQFKGSITHLFVIKQEQEEVELTLN